MSDQPTIEVKFGVGDLLIHPRGATAKVLEAVPHARRKHELHGYRLLITQPDGTEQRATVPLQGFNAGKGWRLMTAAEVAAQKPAVVATEVAVHVDETGEPVMPAEPLDPEGDMQKRDTKAEIDNILEGQVEVLRLHNAFLDGQVEGLRKQVSVLEEQLEAARSERDSAIESLDAANKLIEERSEPVSIADPAPTSRCKEFKVMHGLTGESLAREEKDGWEVEYMQFTEDTALHVVYWRIVTKPTPEPQSNFTFTTTGNNGAQPIAPAITYILPTNEEAVSVLLGEEADLIEAAHRDAEPVITSLSGMPLSTPPRRFNADFQQLLTKTLQAGKETYDGFMQENPLPVHTAVPVQGVTL